MTICLAMIVRDEAANLERNLNAALPLIDSVVLVDTGSVDNTRELAQTWADDHGIPLKLVEEPWNNFEVNRTSLFRHAETQADWMLLLDADLVIHTPDPLPDLNRCDSWHGHVRFAGLEYTLPFLVRSGKPWRYVGVAHSYLACDETFDEAVMDGLWVEDYSHTTVAKLERDVVALLADHSEHPDSPRTVFYLAQTYYDLDRFHEAITYYRIRSDMDAGWDEERYFARYRLGCLLAEHIDFAQGAKELLRAWEERPNRIEALRALAGCATSVANKAIDSGGDRLFVGTRSYLPHDHPTPTIVAESPPNGGLPDAAIAKLAAIHATL